MEPRRLGRCAHLTYKANVRQTRYGWVRLTPAYSAHLVKDILACTTSQGDRVLDPFCGTGTTALACAEQGIHADTVDINPFLLWLTRVKTAHYSAEDIAGFQSAAQTIAETLAIPASGSVWIPPIRHIERWWDREALLALGAMMDAIRAMTATSSEKVIDLLKVAFCRVMMDHSSAAFNHQSMSFKRTNRAPCDSDTVRSVHATWIMAVHDIAASAGSDIRITPGIFLGDARNLSAVLPHRAYTCVITSPPYPNRMSYVREVRPYMYWLAYLRNGREAGELDWSAIGGTWGIATSRVRTWRPPTQRDIPYPEFPDIIARIAAGCETLARYVHKYFYDMALHIDEVFAVTSPGASIHYIIGNSKFYDVVVPAEAIFAAMVAERGFVDVTVRPIRKRSSKKELYEYIVSARRP